MTWIPESADAQPLPIRADFLIRCKILVIRLIAQYKIFRGEFEKQDPIMIHVPADILKKYYLETAAKFRYLADNEMDPLDGNELIED
eukprot:9355470-Prorocentrum_lima.AAC.1